MIRSQFKNREKKNLGASAAANANKKPAKKSSGSTNAATARLVAGNRLVGLGAASRMGLGVDGSLGMHLAASSGNLTLLRKGLKKGGKNKVNSLNAAGETPLFLAAVGGYLDCTKELLRVMLLFLARRRRGPWSLWSSRLLVIVLATWSQPDLVIVVNFN